MFNFFVIVIDSMDLLSNNSFEYFEHNSRTHQSFDIELQMKWTNNCE
jgi:hypothetical protein